MAVDDQELEAFFAAACVHDAPEDDLVARILADADSVQNGFLEQPAPSGTSIFGWLSAIGGWRGAGGLVAATVTGLMVGVYAPDQIDNVLGGSLSELGFVESETLWPGLDDLLPAEEG